MPKWVFLNEQEEVFFAVGAGLRRKMSMGVVNKTRLKLILGYTGCFSKFLTFYFAK